jgi:hypothetical protein
VEVALTEALSGLVICRELEDRWGMIYLLEHLGQLYFRQNQEVIGHNMWLEAFTLAEDIQHPLLPTLRKNLKL